MRTACRRGVTAAHHPMDRESKRRPDAPSTLVGMTDVEVFVDPSCPWAWITSQWIEEVAPQRDLDVTWRSYCLEIRDDYDVAPTSCRAPREAVIAAHALSHRMLRDLRGGPRPVRRSGGRRAVRRVGPSFFVRERPATTAARRDCLAACGLDPDLLDAADDEKWDAPIVESMDVAYEFGGPKTQTPTIVVRADPPYGFKGPVMAPAPTGDGRAPALGRDPGDRRRARLLRDHAAPHQPAARHPLTRPSQRLREARSRRGFRRYPSRRRFPR